MRSFAEPVIVSGFEPGEQEARTLVRVSLRRRRDGSNYDEKWLQDLIHNSSSVLPIGDIEPALADAVSVCRELPTPSGSADNLLITPSGGIVLVEAKLWRNPQARREVIGQILDYAKDLSHWSYEEFEKRIGVARREANTSLFRVVCGYDASADDERWFVDAVSRNLRLGRFLCLVVGDGIQEGAEQLADFLQRHVGLHFTLGLVELSLWQLPNSTDVLVQPRLLARTVQIERAVVGRDGGLIDPAQAATETSPKSTTISEQEFYELLAKTNSTLPDQLREFLAELADIGVYPDIKKIMSLKWRDEGGNEFSLGGIESKGIFWTDYAHPPVKKIGRSDLFEEYRSNLASVVPPEERPTPSSIPLIELLRSATDWQSAIEQFVLGLREATNERY